MNKFTKLFGILLSLCFLVLTACEKDDDDDNEPDEGNQTGQVTFQLEHHVDGKPLLMDSLIYINQAGNQYEVTLLEYIVSRFQLEHQDGSTTNFDTAIYINVEQGNTQSITLTGLPTGTYTSIRFNHGLDSAMNQVGEVPKTNNFINMAWMEGLPGDYHHMKMNGNFDGPDSSGVFNTHCGASEDEQGNYANNHVPMDFSREFTVNPDETTTFRFRINLNEWYANPNEYDFGSLDQPGIMGNHARQVMLRENGHNVYSLL